MSRSEFQVIVDQRLTRRTFFRGLAAGTAAAMAPGLAHARLAPKSTLGFTEIGGFLDETHHLADGYRAQVLLSWGDQIVPGAPKFNPHAQSVAAQSKQFGYNNDFITLTPLDAPDRFLLSVNHEYTNASLMFPGLAHRRIDQVTAAQVAIEMEAHGHTIVEVRQTKAGWRVIRDSKYNRRISATTPMHVAGPASGHARLRTTEDPTGKRVIGTLSNCSGGRTPWGTVLIAEENFDYYFSGNHEREWDNHLRYRVAGVPTTAWSRFHRRFNAQNEPNEPNRFGWVVEIDPKNPDAAPIKRTALGRFKHESATVTSNHDGRVVIYSGDDERFEYVYRYVSNKPYDPERPYSQQQHLLNDGVLAAAKFHQDGTVEWLPLVQGVGPLVAKNGFATQADVVIEARRAADLVGATKMDRPEDIEHNPKTGRVLVALSNNHLRKKTDPANPRQQNQHGHIVEFKHARRGNGFDFAATRHEWGLFLLGGDPNDDGRCHKDVSPNGWLSCPDNLAFDPKGRIWICTDGQDERGMGESIYATDTSGPGRCLTRRFFTAPRGAEVTGACFSPDGETLFLSVQHPGQEANSTFARPTTRWPDFDPKTPPRPSVLAITKNGRGRFGS